MARQRADAGAELDRIDRFAKHLGDLRILGADTQCRIRIVGCEQDGLVPEARVGLQLAGKFQPVEGCHAQGQHRDVVFEPPEIGEQHARVGLQVRDAVGQLAHQHVHQGEVGAVVVDDQDGDLRAHRKSL